MKYLKIIKMFRAFNKYSRLFKKEKKWQEQKNRD